MSLDMSDVILDADLGVEEPIVVIRNGRSTSSQGLTTLSGPSYLRNVFGVVMPASGRQLQRLPDDDRVSSGIAVYTTTPLVAGTNELAPDIIVWQGKNYVVYYIDDFTGSGGFVAAVCTMQNMQGASVNRMTPQ